MYPKKSHYVGRYAPSPTGRLHFGNLRTALLAWLHARLYQGEFLLRFDDLDTPRIVAGSEEKIIEDLNWLGIDWDGDIYRQSEHIQDYQTAIEYLSEKGVTYPCYCSRKDIQQAVSAPHGATPVYPGTCKNLPIPAQNAKAEKKQAATRLLVNDDEIAFIDGIAGRQTESMRNDCGDFVIKRADGLFAYQLAVVVDDIAQSVTDVVRGADLLDSSARQIYLFEQLVSQKSENKPPKYWHVPLLMDAQGQRMAKRDGSDSIEEWQDKGFTAEQLVAEFANSFGLLENHVTTLSATELLESLTLDNFVNALTV